MTRLHKNSNLLARVNFPLYSIQMLTSRHVVVAGGGGSSNTGVANGFEIFELIFDGKNFICKESLRHETGGKVVMNCAAYSTPKSIYLVAGQDAHCQLYNIKWKIVKENDTKYFPEDNENLDNELRNRKHNSAQRDNTPIHHSTEEVQKHLEFFIKPTDCVQTDFSDEEPFQRVIRISYHGNLVASGGTDGYIRIWKFPSFKKMVDIVAHAKEIDDLDFSINERQIVSISKDNNAIVWNAVDGKKIYDLKWTAPNGTKYAYKRCRFGCIENEPDKSRLFTVTNPVLKTSKKPSYIQLWNPENGRIVKQSPYKESLSALAVRNDGKFAAVGTMFSGTVIVFIAFSLQKILKVPEAHSMFITGLEFLPITNTLEDSITTLSEVAVLSVSVDNKICIHNVPYKYGLPLWTVILLLLASVLVAFVFCDFLGL